MMIKELDSLLYEDRLNEVDCLAGAEMSYGKNYSQIFEGLSQGRG